MDTDDIKRKRELLDIWKQRLHLREVQAAQYGMSADPSIPMEIEKIKKQISQLEQELTTAEQEASTAAVRDFRARFITFLRLLETDWSSERDSDPINIDEGKWMLRGAANEVTLFRSQIEKAEGTDLIQLLDEALRRMRAIQRHQLFIDGGVSFNAFWTEGDAILQLLHRVPYELDKAFE